MMLFSAIVPQVSSATLTRFKLQPSTKEISHSLLKSINIFLLTWVDVLVDHYFELSRRCDCKTLMSRVASTYIIFV